MNFIVLGSGSFSRAQEGRTASSGPCCRPGVVLLPSEGSQHRKDCLSVFPHTKAHAEMKKTKPNKEPKPTGLSCAFYDIYIFTI